MRCDLHVHTTHSGMCSEHLLRLISRESYNDPVDLYEILKCRGMDLVTVTDHDSIDAAESLRMYPDFFLSEEVTCTSPSGTLLHVGVFDIGESHHVELQRRRDDLPRFLAYLNEQDLLFAANHVFSGLTGPRTAADFDLFALSFPAVETRNGQMPRASNRSAAYFARRFAKSQIGGSDAHTLAAAARTFTEVRAARTKQEFFEGLRAARCVPRGEHGGYWKLTRAVVEIGLSALAERPWLLPLSPLVAAIPAFTLSNALGEEAFARKWDMRVNGAASPRCAAPATEVAL
jgi:predicted metal-dependent phosphoesterase TrpH